MAGNDIVISCQNVWKVFGPKPESIWDLLDNGVTRQEVIEQTGHVIRDFDLRRPIYQQTAA